MDNDNVSALLAMSGGGSVDPEKIAEVTSEWLEENLATPSTPPIDSSLTVANAAADAKATGDAVDELKSAILNGIVVSYSETLSSAGTLYKAFTRPLPAGSEVLVENKSASTPVNIAFRDKSNQEITTRVTLNGGYSTVVSLPYDAYSVRLYVNGTELHTDISYGENLLGEIQQLNDITKISVGLNDGYYSAQGQIVSPSPDTAEKYTDKISVFVGLKLTFYVEYLNQTHVPWDAICEWKKDGTFIRTALNPKNYKRNRHIYVATEDIAYVAFAFRSYNDCNFTVSVTSNSYALFNAIGSTSLYYYAFNADGVKGVNHRGYNTVAPENTIPAYKLSVEHGFRFVETDVRMTSDNVPVLLHDATINRTSNGEGNISDLTFSQVREYDFGSWKSSEYAGTKIPSLEEFIIFCKRTGIYPYLELSGTYTNSQIKIIYDIAKKYGMELAVTWIGANHSALDAIKNLDPRSRIGVIAWNEATQATVDVAKALMTGMNQVFLNLDITYATTNVSFAKAAGIPIELWTSNSAEDMKNVDPYVNGVASDLLDYATVMKDLALD